MKYEDYLDKVKDSNDDFTEIQDILQRYQTLITENKSLDALNNAQEQKLEKLRMRINNYKKEGEKHKLSLQNEIANKKIDLDNLKM